MCQFSVCVDAQAFLGISHSDMRHTVSLSYYTGSGDGSTPPTWTVIDETATLTAGGSCEAIGEDMVRCSQRRQGFNTLAEAHIELGDQDIASAS